MRTGIRVAFKCCIGSTSPVGFLVVDGFEVSTTHGNRDNGLAADVGRPLVRQEEFMAKYGKKAQSKVKNAMHERKAGTLRSGSSGKKVKSRKQAIAIGLSEARRAGGKVPAKKSAKRSVKRSTRKSTK